MNKNEFVFLPKSGEYLNASYIISVRVEPGILASVFVTIHGLDDEVHYTLDDAVAILRYVENLVQ